MSKRMHRYHRAALHRNLGGSWFSTWGKALLITAAWTAVETAVVVGSLWALIRLID